MELDGAVLRGFPTPSGRLEFYSSTLAGWGWPEMAVPGYTRSQVHPESLQPGEMPLIPTFRLPVQIHTRSANAKWLVDYWAPYAPPPIPSAPQQG